MRTVTVAVRRSSAPMPLALRLLAACCACATLLALLRLPSSASAASSVQWSTLSPSLGVSVETAPLGRSSAGGRALSTSASLCPDAENEPCAPFAVQRACLSADTMAAVWANTPRLLESLYARYDIELRIETQLLETSSLVLTEITRTLLSEVLGFSVKIIVNPVYHSQLPRCTTHFDFHPSIWGTDWSDAELEHAFSGHTTPVSCERGGFTGVLGQDGWFADTKSIDLGALLTPQPLALGYWMAYSTVQGVEGLPRLNVTEADMDKVNTWFVPPLCRVPGAVCGVAYGFSPYWEPGVPAQQVVNLRWLVAIMFPAVDRTWFDLMTPRLERGEQVFAFYYLPDPFTASPLLQHVLLPDPTRECFLDSKNKENGIGPVRCDIRPVNLEKYLSVSTDPDKSDAFALFRKVHVANEDMVALMGMMYEGTSVADAACGWMRNNSHVWSSWVEPATPRLYVAALTSTQTTVTYVLLGFYFLFSLFAHSFLFLNRSHAVVKRSSHLFNQVVVLGASGWYLALVLGLQEKELASCVAVQFIISLSFSAFYGSLLVKNYRIHAIFSQKALKQLHMGDGRMLALLGCYAAADMLLVVLWSAIDPPDRSMATHSTISYARVATCSSGAADIFTALLYVLRGLALLAGAYFAISIRDVEKNFNESRYLALITYNILVVCGIVVALGFIATNAPAMTSGVYLAGVSFAVFLSLGVFVVPKVVTVRTVPAGTRRGGLQHSQDTKADSSTDTGMGMGVGMGAAVAGGTTRPTPSATANGAQAGGGALKSRMGSGGAGGGTGPASPRPFPSTASRMGARALQLDRAASTTDVSVAGNGRVQPNGTVPSNPASPAEFDGVGPSSVDMAPLVRSQSTGPQTVHAPQAMRPLPPLNSGASFSVDMVGVSGGGGGGMGDGAPLSPLSPSNQPSSPSASQQSASSPRPRHSSSTGPVPVASPGSSASPPSGGGGVVPTSPRSSMRVHVSKSMTEQLSLYLRDQEEFKAFQAERKAKQQAAVPVQTTAADPAVAAQTAPPPPQ